MAEQDRTKVMVSDLDSLLDDNELRTAKKGLLVPVPVEVSNRDVPEQCHGLEGDSGVDKEDVVELWLDTMYFRLQFMAARCKRQRLRHNIPEVSQWPVADCHHMHDASEWDPMLVDGSRLYPSKEEAEYTACLAFTIATSVSLWVVRMGFGYTLNVPSWDNCAEGALVAVRLEIHEGVGDVADGMPPDPAEAARVPRRVHVGEVLVDGELPHGHVYVGPGHHRHRLKRTKSLHSRAWLCVRRLVAEVRGV